MPTTPLLYLPARCASWCGAVKYVYVLIYLYQSGSIELDEFVKFLGRGVAQVSDRAETSTSTLNLYELIPRCTVFNSDLSLIFLRK